MAKKPDRAHRARERAKQIEYEKIMRAQRKTDPVEDFLDEIWNHFPGAKVTYHGSRRRHEGIDYGE